MTNKSYNVSYTQGGDACKRGEIPSAVNSSESHTINKKNLGS